MKEGIDDYVKRLSYYIPFETKVIPDLKNRSSLSIELQKGKEGQLILNQIIPGDILILLDERGTEFSSIEFSKMVGKENDSRNTSACFCDWWPLWLFKNG